MNRFLHISFTFNEGIPKVQELEPLFNALAPDWIRYSPNCWIVWTARPASDFMYALKNMVGQSDSFLIVKLDMSERNGWQPQWIWEWVDKKRTLGPPPPPALPPPDFATLFGNNPSPGLLGGLGGLFGTDEPKKSS
jgi:hypothetical protein